jgi:hypothetical protein
MRMTTYDLRDVAPRESRPTNYGHVLRCRSLLGSGTRGPGRDPVGRYPRPRCGLVLANSRGSRAHRPLLDRKIRARRSAMIGVHVILAVFTVVNVASFIKLMLDDGGARSAPTLMGRRLVRSNGTRCLPRAARLLLRRGRHKLHHGRSRVKHHPTQKHPSQKEAKQAQTEFKQR